MLLSLGWIARPRQRPWSTRSLAATCDRVVSAWCQALGLQSFRAVALLGALELKRFGKISEHIGHDAELQLLSLVGPVGQKPCYGDGKSCWLWMPSSSPPGNEPTGSTCCASTQWNRQASSVPGCGSWCSRPRARTVEGEAVPALCWVVTGACWCARVCTLLFPLQ